MVEIVKEANPDAVRFVQNCDRCEAAFMYHRADIRRGFKGRPCINCPACGGKCDVPRIPCKIFVEQAKEEQSVSYVPYVKQSEEW